MGKVNVSPDKDGKYEILLNVPGKYQIDFTKQYTVSNKPGEFPNQITTHKTLSVVSGEYKLDCNLPDSAIQGLVLNPKTGKPVVQTQIAAYQKKKGDEIQQSGRTNQLDYANPVWNHYQTGATDENGRFHFENMESGEWLVAEKTEFGTICASKTFQLKANETKDNIVLMEPECGSLLVTVLDQDSGNWVFPVEMGCTDSTGFVYPPVMKKINTSSKGNVFVLRIATDTTGKVIYPNIPVGEYKLYTRTGEHPTGSTDIEILSGKTTETILKLKKGGRLVFPLVGKNDTTKSEQEYCKLKVLKAKDGKPIMQDANGSYKKLGFYFNSLSLDPSFIMPLPPGEYTVELQINYYSGNRATSGQKPITQTKLLKIEEGRDTLWEINLASLRKLNQ